MLNVRERLTGALDRWMELTGDEVPDEITPDTFDRSTGRPLPGMSRKNDRWRRPAPGVAVGASRIHHEGIEPF